MFDKVLVFGWISLGAILIIENMVSWYSWYLFLDTWASAGSVVIVSILIWAWIWFWIKWLINNKSKNENENEDDYNF